MRRICISMSFCPTQVSKGVEILDRSVALHEKNAKVTSEGARYSCPTAKVMVNLKPETKIETVVASRVLMNMELVERESANRLWFFYTG